MKPGHYLMLSLVVAITAFIVAFSHASFSGEKRIGKRIQEKFDKRQEEALALLGTLSVEEYETAFDAAQKAVERGISSLILHKGAWVFWSDKSVPFQYVNVDSISDGQMVKLANTNYYQLVKKKSDSTLIALINLSSSFPYNNRFINNGIYPAFGTRNGELFINGDKKNGHSIYNKSGEYVFSVKPSPAKNSSHALPQLLSTALLFLSVFLFLLFLRLSFNSLSEKKAKYWLLPAVAGLIALRVVFVYSGLFAGRFYLFDPFIFASRISPSMGDLLLNTIVFTFVAYLFYKHASIPGRFLNNAFNRNAWTGILNVFYILMLFYAFTVSKGIITNSSLRIIPANISEITLPVVLAYLVFAANYLAVFFIGFFIFNTLKEVNKYKLIINCSSLLLILFIAGFAFRFVVDIYTIIFGILLYVLIGLTYRQIKKNVFFSSMVFFLLLFSTYILVFIVKYNTDKEIQVNKSLAISLSSEHDPVAEYMLEDVSERLSADSAVFRMLFRDRFDGVKLYNYLSNNYFSSYFKKYNARITVCTPVDSVMLETPAFAWYHCYSYFEEYISAAGLQVPNSSFYFIDNFSGLINYIGWVKYNKPGSPELSLFLELESKHSANPLGYPELLLDEQVQTSSAISEKSYAKYYKGRLVSQAGAYEYSLKSNNFERLSTSNFYNVRRNNHIHLVYRPDEYNIIVISEKAVGTTDIVVLFSYIFIFYYILLLLLNLVFITKMQHLSFRDNLRNKIQVTMVSVLLVSLVLIAGSTTWFNIRKYNQTQLRMIKEKIQSVYIELDHKLSFESELTKNWTSDKYDDLSQLLIKFSDVFYTDINLYAPDGVLLATSRSEIFQMGLQNERMDPLAYSKLHREQLAKFIHREHIGKLNYLSAYVPFFNSNGQLLAYLNLPYFTKQKDLQDDITTITVAIINIYVLLILITLLVVVVLSSQITKPLEMLQLSFRGLALGGKYEKIQYSRNDEIGKLVEEYNNMVGELERNVELLARSERESAWREMAKQVAHEIKNPLTPMRLSVQQLKRSWGDKKENFEEYLNNVTNLLVEQIDNLSAIASEFSNFAKMPVARFEIIELGPVLEKAVSLFCHEKVEVLLEPGDEKLYVKADTEQLNRVFINIIKNGIQAISDEEKGLVKVILERHKNMAIIQISDNGKGISDEVQAKLFTPNFTTKSSGMGLGLTIVKNILDQMDSKIKYETKTGEGTTFKIYIPLKQ
ncbi:MAG: GHKL domain-containing protein [Bacteroidales bacterium]|nr:GHKL domain-containing protein [Bacteroidales bacterium]